VVVAPGDDVLGADVPGQVDQHVAGAEVLAERAGEVVRGDLVLDVLHTGRQRPRDAVAHVRHVHDGQSFGRHVQVAQQ
jgi:hypothetical protein